MILVAPERAARRADRTPSPPGGGGGGGVSRPTGPPHGCPGGGLSLARRGGSGPDKEWVARRGPLLATHIAHIRVKGACTYAVRARDRAARATGSRVTLHQQSPHDSGVRLRALCRLRSAIITELCRLRCITGRAHMVGVG